MKIEQQVCTLEQAKRFAELKIGEDYEPLYVWVPKFPVFNDAVRLCAFTEFVSRLNNSILSDDAKALVGYYPAFTVAELGIMLPSETSTQRTGSENSEYANWEWTDDGNGEANGLYNTEAEARAALLIYLLENNKTTPEEVNQRLTA